jgi:GDPmannose 4,6-dehydratase
MWLMLQQDRPGDYVIASGETFTVRDFVSLAFSAAGISIRWEGCGLEERGIDVKTKKVIVKVDPKYFRPTEVELLWGNAEKARRELGWVPKTKLRELIAIMVDYDLSNDTYGGLER